MAPPPYSEYTLARVAHKSAQDADSARFASGYWLRADESYRKAQKAFNEGDFDVAKDFFTQSLQWSEKAENATRLKKFQSGESFQ